MATHEAAADIHVKVAGVNGPRRKRTKRRVSEVTISEPAPDDRTDVPVLDVCPACGTEIPHRSDLQRWVDNPEGSETPGQYACSEKCADEIADRVDHIPELPDRGFQWVRRA